MVVLRIEIAILMLQKVDGYEDPLREEPGASAIFQRGTPVGDDENDQEAISKDSLGDRLPIKLRPRLPPVFKVAGFIAIHRRNRSEEEEQQVNEIPPVPYQRAADEILIGIVTSMVKDIV